MYAMVRLAGYLLGYDGIEEKENGRATRQAPGHVIKITYKLCHSPGPRCSQRLTRETDSLRRGVMAKITRVVREIAKLSLYSIMNWPARESWNSRYLGGKKRPQLRFPDLDTLCLLSLISFISRTITPDH